MLRRLIPRAMRQAARGAHRASALRRGLAKLRHDPLRTADDQATLRQLVYGWGNSGFSAEHEYLAAVIRTAHSLTTADDILECGSGLSTLVLAVVAERTGRRVVTLEHIPEWASRVRQALARAGLHAAEVIDAPLVTAGEGQWYRYAADGRRFALVVCDGPPAATPGGRYGLLPAMRDAFVPGCTILLDDLERPDEQVVLSRWTRETGGASEIVGTSKPFGVLRLR